MSDNNSDSNYDDDYSGFLDYLSSEHRYGSIVVICIIVLYIIIGIYNSSEDTNTYYNFNNFKYIIIFFIFWDSIFGLQFF